MKKLVAYVTAALPDREFSVDAILALQESGVDMVEIGIPFSDPVADGGVIEKAGMLSLQNGFRLNDLFYISSRVSEQVETLWMGYFNPFYSKGVEYFLQKGKEFGVSGFLIPDLPHEESLRYLPEFEKAGLNLITFVAPTDSRERIETITKQAKKFIYLVAYAGITGSGRDEDLTRIIDDIRAFTHTPVYLGFGVNEHNAQEKAKNVDGVIVGSALVKIVLEEGLTNVEKISRMSALAKEIKEKINS